MGKVLSSIFLGRCVSGKEAWRLREIYNDIRQAYDYDNGRKWLGVKLSANKSYFFFDDEIVALGSAINTLMRITMLIPLYSRMSWQVQTLRFM